MLGIHQTFPSHLGTLISDAHSLGNTTFQCFMRNCRNNSRRYISPYEIDYFNQAYLKNGMESFVIHASYIMNPATSSAVLHEKTVNIIRSDLLLLQKLVGVKYYVLHPGSSLECSVDEALDNIVKTLLEVKDVIGTTTICLEIMAGAGSQLLYNVEQCLLMLKELRYAGIDNVFLCYDTCHAYAAGMDLFQSYNTLSPFIKVVHLNNSKYLQKTFRDRHENIMSGHINPNELISLIKLVPEDVPVILETPSDNLINDLFLVKEMLCY